VGGKDVNREKTISIGGERKRPKRKGEDTLESEKKTEKGLILTRGVPFGDVAFTGKR